MPEQAASPSWRTSTEKWLRVSSRLRNLPRETSSSTIRIFDPVDISVWSWRGSSATSAAEGPSERASPTGDPDDASGEPIDYTRIYSTRVATIQCERNALDKCRNVTIGRIFRNFEAINRSTR